MKAKFGTVEVEGTPEEIGALIRSLQSGASDSPVVPGDLTGSRSYIPEEIAFRVLKRRPLSPEQRVVLASLQRNHPSWTTAIELQKATKYNPNQLGGLMGAFGKRMSSTPGYQAGDWFFEQEWDYEESCHKYRLPPGALAAVKRAGI